MKRPLESDCAPFHKVYLNKVEGDDVISVLQQQNEIMLNIFSSIDEEKGKFSYAPGKWSIKELLGHIVDSERVFSYRAMSIARGEKQPLPGFEQDDFVKGTDFNNRNISSLAEEYRHLRASNIELFKNFREEDLNKKGTVSNNSVSVRALVFITAGHEKHHINILKEKYNV